jgi:acylglycerol lipase
LTARVGSSSSRALAPENRPRAIVTLVHGFKSHSGLYERVAAHLVERRFAVYAFDLRGHGRSEGERLFVQKFSDYVDDLAAIVALAKSREPGIPTFVLGHSAGGVVSTVYALDHRDEISGLICESFAHEVPAPDFALAIIKGVGHLAPHAHLLKLKDEDFSRDPTFVARMKEDPLIPKIGYAAETVAELVRADERLKREFSRITLPIFIIHRQRRRRRQAARQSGLLRGRELDGQITQPSTTATSTISSTTSERTR